MSFGPVALLELNPSIAYTYIPFVLTSIFEAYLVLPGPVSPLQRYLLGFVGG